jgi:hypothetical protein
MLFVPPSAPTSSISSSAIAAARGPLFGAMAFANRVLELTRDQHLLAIGVVLYGATTLYLLQP